MGIGFGVGKSAFFKPKESSGGGFTQDLVASWQFESDFTDYTGNHNATATGTVNAGVSGGKVGNCAEFDGSSDFLTVSDSNDFSFTNGSDTSFTISFWFNKDVGSNQMLINKRDATSGGDEWNIYSLADGTIHCTLFDGVSNAIYIGRKYTLSTTLNTWYHVAITYDGSETSSGIKIYTDGVEQTTTDNSSGVYTGMNNGTAPVKIGAAGWSDSTWNIDGTLDEVKVYKNRVLTSDEVSTMYTSENAGTSVL